MSGNTSSIFASLTGGAHVNALQQVSEQSRRRPSEVGMRVLILDIIQFPHVFKDPTPWQCYSMKRS